MKKLLFSFALLISQILSGQNVWLYNFPGNDVQLLENKELKVIEKSEGLQKYGYDGFYLKNDLKTKFSCCESFNSKYSSLVGKVFKVLSFEPYTNRIGTAKYKLKLENIETGIIYFDYSPQYEHSFPFEVVGGLTLPEDFYCKKITKEVDKFTGETRYSTEMVDGIYFMKNVKDSLAKIYLGINEGGTTANVGKEGLILLLENDKRIERPNAKIDIKVNSSSSSVKYIYSAFIELTDIEVNLLLENKITDDRLYIYDGKIKNGQKIIEYLKCLTK